MTLLVVLLAVVAPVLSNSMRGRGLQEEATRFLALTEFARSEAVSQGVPTQVWVEPGQARYGMEVKTGYETIAGASTPHRDYTLAPETKVELKAAASGNRLVAADFTADGVLGLQSAESVRFTDRFGETATVARMADGWGYEIVKDPKRR
jgi:Tfp pilus assembly protein FimT